MLPYLPTVSRLALAGAVGLFVGIERERRKKEAGLRTFAFAGLLGAVGAMLGQPYALLAVALLGVLVVLLNIETIRTGEGAEITTSAALLLTGFAGVLAGFGHTFTPTVLGIATAALLAWKEPLAGFSRALTEPELRSAILLAILGFVIYPLLQPGTVDPWGLVDPQAAWVTVILIAALGFVNYVLLKLYGERGVVMTGFLGGLVNSTITITEIARRTPAPGEGADATHGTEVAFRGVAFAAAAMIVRNAVILGLFAPGALRAAGLPLVLMLAGVVGAAVVPARERAASSQVGADAPEIWSTTLPGLESPFALRSALRFGFIFLAVHVAGTLAQRAFGAGGFYGVSAIGGAVSSASAVASAANLAAAGTLPPVIAGTGAVFATAASTLVSLPLVARVARNPNLWRRVARTVVSGVTLGLLGILLQWAFTR